MHRSCNRHVLAAILLTALAGGAPALPSTSQAQAAPQAPTEEMRQVQEISQRRRALTLQLNQQRLALARAQKLESELRAQLDKPENAAERAPDARARLLDKESDALQTVVYLAGQLQAGSAEWSELGLVLSDIVAQADAAASAAATDATPKGRMLGMQAKQQAALLKMRAQLGAPAQAESKRVQAEVESAAWKSQRAEAEQRLAKVDAEPRFGKLSETPPRTAKGRFGQPAQGAALKACNVREVDWKNVTITISGRSMLLIDGQGPIEPQRGGMRSSVTVKQLDFADTNGDQRDEALMLVEREEYAAASADALTSTVPALYVFDITPECGLRRLAEVALPSGGRAGKPVAGGYEYESASDFRDYR